MMVSLLALCLLPIPVQGVVIPAAQQDRLFTDLVAQIRGPSERGYDVPTHTEADEACDQLVKIGMPAASYVLKELDSKLGWAKVHAMEILVQLRDARAVKPMLAILNNDPENGVRGIAAYNLGAFHDPTAIPDLLQAAKSSIAEVARGAWNSLGELRAPQAVPILIQHLDSKVRTIPGGNQVTDQTPIGALAKIGGPAIKPLAIVLEHEKGTRRDNAALALGQMKEDDAAAVLRKSLLLAATKSSAMNGLLRGDRADVVPLAIEALKDRKFANDAVEFLLRHPDARCLPNLKKAMAAAELRHDYRDFFVIPDGVKIIVRLKDRSSIPLLLHLLKSKVEQFESMRALGEFRDPRAIPLMVKLVEQWTDLNNWGDPPAAAARELARFGAKAVDALLQLLKRSPKSANGIGRALASIEDPTAAPKLAILLTDNYPTPVRLGATEALGEMKYRSAANAIAKELGDRSKPLHLAATRALALMGDARAIAPLAQMATTPEGPYLGRTWAALGSQAMPTLKKLFAAGNFGAADAIAHIQIQEATTLLIDGLKAKDPAIAAICARALGARHAPGAAEQLIATLDRPEIAPRFEAYMALRGLERS